MSLFQAIKSISSLLLRAQRSVDGNIKRQSDFLSTISSFIQSLQTGKHCHTSKGTEMTARLFRFFHLEVLKTLKRESEE